MKPEEVEQDDKRVASNPRVGFICRAVVDHFDGDKYPVPQVQIALRHSAIEEIGGQLMATITVTAPEVMVIIGMLARSADKALMESVEGYIGE